MALNKGKVEVKHLCGHVRMIEFETIQPVDIAARDIKTYDEKHICWKCRVDSRRYELGRVYIDSPVDDNQADDTIPAYYCTNDSWNGWAMPYFTREQGMEYLAWQQRRPWNTKPGRYDEEQDAFVTFIDPDADSPDGEVWHAEQITVNGETLTVYGIGNGSWIWEAVEE